MKPYRAAIIGCGRIGSGFDDDPRRKFIPTHAGAYSKSKSIELVSICDIDKVKLEKCGSKLQVPSLFTDYNDMLIKEKPDIVSICTPQASHFKIAQDLVSAGVKAIFCEKPIADNIKHAREMVRLCRKKGVVLQIGHQRRFDPNISGMKDHINSGKLGAIQQASFYYIAGINNTGSHMFDLLLFLFGDADWIIGTYSKNSSAKQEDPNIDGVIRFKSGVLATFQACDVNKFFIFDFDILGSLGRIKILRTGFALEFYSVKQSDLVSEYNELIKSEPPFKATDSKDFLLFAVDHLADCIRNSKESKSSGEDGTKSLELINAALLSADNNEKKVFLPL